MLGIVGPDEACLQPGGEEENDQENRKLDHLPWAAVRRSRNIYLSDQQRAQEIISLIYLTCPLSHLRNDSSRH